MKTSHFHGLPFFEFNFVGKLLNMGCNIFVWEDLYYVSSHEEFSIFGQQLGRE